MTLIQHQSPTFRKSPSSLYWFITSTLYWICSRKFISEEIAIGYEMFWLHYFVMIWNFILQKRKICLLMIAYDIIFWNVFDSRQTPNDSNIDMISISEKWGKPEQNAISTNHYSSSSTREYFQCWFYILGNIWLQIEWIPNYRWTRDIEFHVLSPRICTWLQNRCVTSVKFAMTLTLHSAHINNLMHFIIEPSNPYKTFSSFPIM